MENYNNGPIMFVYPSELLREYVAETGEPLSLEAHKWAALLDEMTAAFDAKGREDRRAGRSAADWECFLGWALKQFGQQDAGEIAELMQDYYMDGYNSGLVRKERTEC